MIDPKCKFERCHCQEVVCFWNQSLEIEKGLYRYERARLIGGYRLRDFPKPDHFLNAKDDCALEKAGDGFDFILSAVNVSLNWNAYINTLRPKGIAPHTREFAMADVNEALEILENESPAKLLVLKN